jgi:hypothetical protein
MRAEIFWAAFFAGMASPVSVFANPPVAPEFDAAAISAAQCFAVAGGYLNAQAPKVEQRFDRELEKAA